MLIRRISVVLGCLLGCADSRSPFPAEVTLSPVDTLITTESALLVRPTEITVGDDGRLFMADAGASVIVVTGPEGDFRQAIGRQGAGPGEFERPRSMVVFRDTLMLIDGGQGRLVIFSTAGKFVASRSLPTEATSNAVSLLPSREMLIARQGNDSALARRYLPDGTRGARLGTPVAPDPEVWDFSAIKKDIADGRVPDFLRNLTLPVLGPDRSATLVMMAERLVFRYDQSDSLEWSYTLEAPELDAILQRFFELNRADSNPSQFYILSYVTAAKLVDDDLWLQLRTPPEVPGVILVLDPRGKLKRRMVIPIGLDDAILLRARLP